VQLFSNISLSWLVNYLPFNLPVLLCCQAPWRGTQTSCRLGAVTVWSCSGTSELRLFSPSVVSKGTDRKYVDSSGARTTNCWHQVEMITRYEGRISSFPLSAAHVHVSVPSLCYLPPAVTRMEPLERPACAAVHRALGSSEGHRVVASPARPFGLWRRHSRPLHPLLEHSDWPAPAMHRHRLSSLQSGLVQAH